ncbi:uncharacterized protein LOC141708689 isoform X1 [Apium graveolens]|uniref:uncharacterized protein LOC141708689 isoform X1 n=1 Tax=Apium graveolens TaxID=4045 RepID=UPI003D790355
MVTKLMLLASQRLMPLLMNLLFIISCWFIGCLYGDQIPVKELAERVASYVHLCTLYWWLRPFGCGVVLGGYDRDGPQLYMIEPSGVSYKYINLARDSFSRTHLACGSNLQEACVSGSSIPGSTRKSKLKAVITGVTSGAFVLLLLGAIFMYRSYRMRTSKHDVYVDVEGCIMQFWKPWMIMTNFQWLQKTRMCYTEEQLDQVRVEAFGYIQEHI